MSFNYKDLPPENYDSLAKYFNATDKRTYSNDKDVVVLSTNSLNEQFGDEDQWPEGLKKALAPYKVDRQSKNFDEYANKELTVFYGTNMLYDSEQDLADILEKGTRTVSDWVDKQERMEKEQNEKHSDLYILPAALVNHIDQSQQKKQHNALANYVARQPSLIHTADGKYVVIAPDDADRNADDFADLEKELEKYRGNYKKYKQNDNENYLPYDPPRVKVTKSGKAEIVVDKTQDTETVGQWLKRREIGGQPNYLLPVISEAGLSKVLDLDGEVLKSFKLPGKKPRKPPKNPIAGVPAILNDNIDKDISDKGSINRADMSPVVTRVEKKCGSMDFIELVRQYADEVASGRMTRAEADRKIDSIVEQQMAIQSEWDFFLMDYKQDWRVEKDGSNPVYIDQDSQADYSDVTTINRDIVDDYNGLTEDYLPEEIMSNRRYTTTPDKYNNYRRGRAALELEINRSLTDEVFQQEVEKVSNLIDLIEFLKMVKDNDENYQIPEKFFKQLDTLMQGNMLSQEDKTLIKESLRKDGKITDWGLKKRLDNLRGFVGLVRGKPLLDKIEQIKRKADFVNGKLSDKEDISALRDLLEVNYLGKEHEQLKKLILAGDFDDERVKRAMGKLHNGLLKMDNAKERYVRIQAQNRLNLIKQGKIDEAFNALGSSEFNKNLCATLIRDFAKDNVRDLTIEDLNYLYRYRDSLNQYLQDQHLDDIEDVVEREQIVRQAIITTIKQAKIDELFDSLKSDKFTKNLPAVLIRDFARDNIDNLTIEDIGSLYRHRESLNQYLLSQNLGSIADIDKRDQIVNQAMNATLYLAASGMDHLTPEDIDCLYRYGDGLNQHLQNQHLDDIKDVAEREQVIRQAINNTLYLATYLEQGQPSKAIRNDVESAGVMSRLSSAKANIDKAVKRIASENPDLAEAINHEASKHNNKADNKLFSKRSDKVAKHVGRANAKQKKMRSKSLYIPQKKSISKRRHKSTSSVLMNKKMKRYRARDLHGNTNEDNHWLHKARGSTTHLPQNRTTNGRKLTTKLPRNTYHGDHQPHFHHARKQQPNTVLRNPHHSQHQHHRAPQFRPIIKTF